MNDYSERRRHRRIRSDMNVRVSTIEPERDPWTGRPFFRATQETCGNVSRGGAFVRVNEPLPPGRRILLELALPDGGTLEAIGRVAWTKRVTTPRPDGAECGIGVEFLGGASDQFLALQGYIESVDDEVIDGDEAFEDA